jgi:hypothetical protein
MPRTPRLTVTCGRNSTLTYEVFDAAIRGRVRRGFVEGAGFGVEALLERVGYPEEVETKRAYLLARRRT